MVKQVLGRLFGDDALRETLDDSRLADARITDENRVVLCPARQNGNHAVDLVVAADDGIKLVLRRESCQVDAVDIKHAFAAAALLGAHAHSRHVD